MMRRLYIFICLLLVISFILPLNIYAADTTYGQFLDDLTQAEKELQNNKNLINNAKGNINSNNNKIKSMQNEIQNMINERNKLAEEILDAEKEIKEKKEQTRSVISYLQLSKGDNVYLEYVFGTDSITDLVYRMSIVEQITEYNDKVMKDMEELIDKNNKRRDELEKKEVDYNNRITNLYSEISRLNNQVSKLGDISPSLEQEVKAKKELVEYYKSQGCSKRSDVIGKDCAREASNGIFYRPLQEGYVTSYVGYRWGSLHRGIDLSSKYGRNTKLYSIGYGYISSIWKDTAGALCVNVIYKYGQTNYTAIYCHLSRYGNIYKNMKVDPNTVLGYMGDTGHAYGVHLHLEVWPCRYGVDSVCSNWDKYTNFVTKSFNGGFKGASSVINFPSKTYQTWYTR